MAGSAPKGSRLPLQKSLSRRVSFNESSLRRRDDADSEAQSGGGRRGSICNRCCFWISLIIGLLLFALILLGSVYFAFLKSNLPSVRLQVLEVNKIDVVSTSKDTLLTAEFVVHLNLTNGNGKAELHYKDMKGSLTSAGINFGEIKIGDMKQPAQSSMGLNMTMVIKEASVEDAAAKELQESGKNRSVVIDVVVRGKIDVLVEGTKIKSMPFKIECDKIEQTAIEGGRSPKCTTELAPI